MSEEIKPALAETVHIKIKDITVDKAFNPRVKYRGIEELGASIRRDGQITPIIVNTLEGDKFALIAGHRRVKAMKKVGFTHVVAQVATLQEGSDQKWLNFIENEHRENLTGFERANALQGLKDEGMSVAQIVKRYGVDGEGKGRISKSQVENLLRANAKLAEGAKKAWQAGELGNEAAFKLASQDLEYQEHYWQRFKGRSGKALREIVADIELAETGGGSTGDDDDAPPPEVNSKPSKKAIEKALDWARYDGRKDYIIALEWALGVRGSLTGMTKTALKDMEADQAPAESGK